MNVSQDVVRVYEQMMAWQSQSFRDHTDELKVDVQTANLLQECMFQAIRIESITHRDVSNYTCCANGYMIVYMVK